MKIIGILKGLLLFVYIHKKKNLSFFVKKKKKKKIKVCFNFAQHNNEQTLHTLKNTGLKTTQFGLGKYRTKHI